MTVCRICLKTKGTIPIYGNPSQNLACAISTFGGITISIDDYYPKYLCESCHVLLQEAILFRKTAQSSDLILKESCKSEPTKVDGNKEVLNVEFDLTAPIVSNTPIDRSMKPEPELEQYNDSPMDMNIEVLRTPKIEIDLETCESKSTKNTKLLILACEFEFICKLCNIQFDTVQEYNNHNLHATTHQEQMCTICKQMYAVHCTKKYNPTIQQTESLFVCKICYKNVHNIPCGNETIHMCKDDSLQKANKVHEEQKMSLFCTQCNIEFNEVEEYRKHRLLTKHGKKLCNICEKSYAVRHTETHNPITDKTRSTYLCLVCYNSFVVQKVWKSEWKCERCPLSFSTLPEYKNHIHTHNEEMKSCPICKKSYKKKFIKVHTKRAHTEKLECVSNKAEVKCEHCNLSFSTSLEYESHILTHNKDTEMCPICKKSYIVAHLELHIRRAHPKTSQCGSDRVKTNCEKKCEYCNMSFSSSEYKKHLFTHSEDITMCPICKKNYTVKYLRIHMQTHNQIMNSLCVCDICGKKVKRRNIRLHKKTHFPRKRLTLKCPVCSETVLRTSLKMHMRVHTGEKPYSCNECSKTFAHKSNLTKHNFSHKKEHEFKCECGKEYHTKRELELHIKAVHDGVQHVCQICDMAYSYRGALMKHQRRVHKREKLKLGHQVSCESVNKEENKTVTPL